MPNRDLKVTIIGEDKSSGAFGSASNNADGFHSKIGALGKNLALAFGGAALAGVAGVGAALVQGAKDAASYQKITDQVAQTIKSTGNAAGVSIGGLKDYAGQLESISGVDEETILSGQNVLLTFTNVQNKVGKGNDIFNQASEAALNLSTTMGGDLVGANTLVGKALNDPITGMTALRRAGVQLTDAQQEQIKTMVASGDTMGAQKILLGELTTQFGGAAEAAGKGLTGSLARAKDAFQDMFRNIATALLPKLAELAQFFAQNVVPVMMTIATNVIPVLSTAFKTVGSVIGAVVGFFRQHNDAAKALAVVAGTVAALIAAAWVAQAAAAVAGAVRSVSSWIAVATGAQVAAEGTTRSTLQIVFGWVAAAASAVANAAVVVAGWVMMGVQSLIQAARMAAAWLIAMGPVGWVIAAVVALVALIVANWQTVVQWTTTAWNAVTGAISAAWNWITGIVSSAITAVRVVISGVWNWITSATSAAWNAVTGAVSSGVSNVIGFVQSLPGRVMSAIGNLGSLLVNVGKNLLEGLWNGISGAASWLLSKVGAFFGNLLPGWVRSMLGIKSPSTVFAEMGRYLMQGMAVGIGDEQQTAVDAALDAAGAITGAMRVQGSMALSGNAQALTVGRPGTLIPATGASLTAGIDYDRLAAAINSASRPPVNIEKIVTERNETGYELAAKLAFDARIR